MVYGEVQNLVPYSTNTNYIQLLSIEDEDGKLLKKQDIILNKLCNIIGMIIVTASVVEYEGEDLSSLKYYISPKSST